MLQDLACTVVYVSDLNKARAFYRDVLGMAVDESVGWTQFRSNGAALVLMPKPEAVNSAGGSTVRVMFRVAKLDRVCRELADAKVKFVAQPAATAFGKQATICDPEGNAIDLIEWNVPSPSAVVSDQTVVNEVLRQSPEAMEVLEEHGIRICGGCIVLLNGSVRETAEYSGLSATETSELVEELNEKLAK